MDRYRVKPGMDVDLSAWDANDKSLFDGDKQAGKHYLKQLNDRLEFLQELLYAEGKHKVLIVLQGMDASGKDGTIRHVFEGVNPQGVKVASFKTPTSEELAHDFLWRIHKNTPANGEMVIFNRSHYEDVLIVRVHNLVSPAVWQKRYAQIAEFENILIENGTTILKFFLHITKDEQKERLIERRDAPEKQWKFNVGDLKERSLWMDYQKAFDVALSKTSTEQAPWYIIPSNRKWYRNILISEILLQKLTELNMQFPEPDDGLDFTKIEID
ncbi:MAG: polyphosphate kinase 2 family protein [Anaerolineales bacterium]|nr:polyphosphate kinase 2 family protein [Anaerolineales bacterium]